MGIYFIQVSTGNGQWEKWSEFCRDVALNPILVSYQDPMPILNTYVRQYRTGSLAPIIRQVHSYTVEDVVWPIGQDLANMGSPGPASKVKGR